MPGIPGRRQSGVFPGPLLSLLRTGKTECGPAGLERECLWNLSLLPVYAERFSSSALLSARQRFPSRVSLALPRLRHGLRGSLRLFGLSSASCRPRCRRGAPSALSVDWGRDGGLSGLGGAAVTRSSRPVFPVCAADIMRRAATSEFDGKGALKVGGACDAESRGRVCSVSLVYIPPGSGFALAAAADRVIQ